MSTIQPQQFASRPVQHAAVGALAPEPQTSVAPYQATPAYTQNDGRAMAALGATLGDFFGRAAQTAQAVVGLAGDPGRAEGTAVTKTSQEIL